MYKEIGSEFWNGCTPLDGNGVMTLMPLGFKVQLTLSGRTALSLIIQDILKERKGGHKVYMPSYCCHTMIEPFLSAGIQVVFYDVCYSETGLIKHFEIENDCDIIILMDYFGFIDPLTAYFAKKFKELGKTVIYDATHSFFCAHIDYSVYDYVFASFRKWFGVNAAFCSKHTDWVEITPLKNHDSFISLRNTSFQMKASYMQGVKIEKSSFLKNFSDAEIILESDYQNYKPDEQSMQALMHLNVEYLRNQRRTNAIQLISAFSENEGIKIAIKDLGEDDVPLFIPLDIKQENRDNIRKYLISNNAYFPVHWPISNIHKISERALDIYEREMSCICDQRYGQSEMDRLIDLINNIS